MRYKMHNKVVIVSKRVVGMNNKGAMDKYLGRTMTIAEVETGHWGIEYMMEEDRGRWSWSDRMIDLKATQSLNGFKAKGI